MLSTRFEDSAAILTLNRPQVHNALSSDLIKSLMLKLCELKNDENCKTIILQGAGEKTFCAGADLKERSGMSEEETLNFLLEIQKLILVLHEYPKITIVAINGDAYGGGLELALACDFRITHAFVRLGLTETSLGIIPGAGGTQLLPKIVGFPYAMEMILLAKKISGQEALSKGLVNQLANPGDILKSALSLSQNLSKNSSLALQLAKKSIHEGYYLSLEKGLKKELDNYKNLLFNSERRSKLQAFLNKGA